MNNTSANNISSIFQDEDTLDIKKEIIKYLRFWPWFLLAMTLSLLSGYFYLKYSSRIFETTAKVKILDETDGLELPTSAFIFKRSNINLENEIEIISSYRILEHVVRDLKLNTQFFEEGRIQRSRLLELPFHFNQLVSADSISKAMTYEVYVKDTKFEIKNTEDGSAEVFESHSTNDKEHSLPFELFVVDENLLESYQDKKFIIKFFPIKSKTLALKNSLKVEAIGEQSDLLKLSIKGEKPAISEKILDYIVHVFDNDGIEDRRLVSKRTLDFIDERFVFLAKELDSIEIDRKEFKERNNLVDLKTDATIGLELRTQSKEEVFRIENQLALAKLLRDALVNNQSETELLPPNIGLENANVNALIEDYNKVVIEKDKLITSGGANNPSVQLLVSKIEVLKSNIDKALQAYNQQLIVSQTKLQNRYNGFYGDVSQIPMKEYLLRDIERQQKIKESLYLLLLQKREEAAINFAITEPSVKIVEYALSGVNPISPRSKIIIIGALLFGLLLPFSVLYLRFMLDTKLHSKEDLDNINTGTPIIAEIPSVKQKELQAFEDPNDRSMLSEAFRILSSNVNYMVPSNKENHGKVIYCTSTIKGEGKTFVSVNLSLALSSINKKVLLIGADLRNPQIHAHLKIDKTQEGLTNYLHDQSIDWRSIKIKGFDKHLNHDTIISGPIPPNPASLLTNGRFKQLVEEAKEEYDYVIIDTAPTILVTDTMLISQLADATIYIARANFTEKDLLNFSKDLSSSGKLKNMAYVINGVGASKSYNYSYNYNYGYNYGYGSKS